MAGEVRAEELLQIWSHRLRMNRDGITAQWPQELKAAVEDLVRNLQAIPGHEAITIDASEGDAVAKFVRLKTGDTIGAIATVLAKAPL